MTIDLICVEIFMPYGNFHTQMKRRTGYLILNYVTGVAFASFYVVWETGTIEINKKHSFMY